MLTLPDFYSFLYRFNRDEILHSTVVKIRHITQFIYTPYLEKLKPTFCRDSWSVAVYIWLQLCQILTAFNSFCSGESGQMYKTGHAFTYSLLKESVANDVINMSLWACCEPRHRRVEASSVGLSQRRRRTFWTLLMIATLKITMSKWQHCKLDCWRWLLLFSFAVNVNEQRIVAFLTEKCCYLSLRSKVRTQLRWCGKFYYSRM